MKIVTFMSNRLLVVAAVAFFGASMTTANAESPCPTWGHYNEFGECKVLVEINSSDGDIGFHFLVDGDNLIRTSLFNPHWRKIWSYYVRRELREQTLTESFNESAEPLCWDDPEEEDEEIVTLADFVDRWKAGRYLFIGLDNEWDWAVGKTYLTFNLPAAPEYVDFELEEEEEGEFEGEISWAMGEGLGECWDAEDGEPLPHGVHVVTEVGTGDPEDDDGEERIVAWEIVLEPEFDDEPGEDFDINSQKGLVYSIRVGADELSCEDETIDGDTVCLYEQEVPDDYLDSLPEGTPLKVEIGAITSTDNATFTEEDGFCSTPDDCDED